LMSLGQDEFKDSLAFPDKGRKLRRIHDQQVLQGTLLAKTRLQKLSKVGHDARALLVPDGTAGEYLHYALSGSQTAGQFQPHALHEGCSALDVSDKGSRQGLPRASEAEAEAQFQSSDTRVLLKPKVCYTCKKLYVDVHHFYFSLCPECAALNFAKRFQIANLTGRIAVVTGARIKIGMEVVLKLLRSGAQVIGTTRYPRDALDRFSSMPDFNSWKHRLRLVGVDFRYLSRVEEFAEYAAQNLPHVDIIVNNAAQTIKRPSWVLKAAEERERQLTISCPQFENQVIANYNDTLAATTLDSADSSPGHANMAAEGIDVNGLPVDTSSNNSWMLKLHEVSTTELAEVFLINALAPFVLVSRLKRLLQQSPHCNRFIINVSAMEGQFNRCFKKATHPHTNMAKASLNMMTRTSAADFAQDCIFMNSVDTGWVNDEKPLHLARRHYEMHNFQTPLDEIDAAARILDPIYCGINDRINSPAFGKFFKDYHEILW